MLILPRLSIDRVLGVHLHSQKFWSSPGRSYTGENVSGKDTASKGVKRCGRCEDTYLSDLPEEMYACGNWKM